MKIAQLILATVLDSSHDTKVGCPCSLHYCPLFQLNRIHEICQRGDRDSSSRHNSRQRQIPMPASPRHRARCNRHEARAVIVALFSCCLVRHSNGGLGPPGETVSLPACTQRSIRRGAASSSRLDRWLSVGMSVAATKHFFSLCLTEHPFQIQNLSIFFLRPRELGLRTSLLRVDRKRYHLRTHQFPRSCCNCTAARWASRNRGARLLQS